MTKVEIVICEGCQGHGCTTHHETTNYHRGEYDVVTTECWRCGGYGRLQRTTTVALARLKN